MDVPLTKFYARNRKDKKRMHYFLPHRSKEMSKRSRGPNKTLKKKIFSSRTRVMKPKQNLTKENTCMTCLKLVRDSYFQQVDTYLPRTTFLTAIHTNQTPLTLFAWTFPIKPRCLRSSLAFSQPCTTCSVAVIHVVSRNFVSRSRLPVHPVTKEWIDYHCSPQIPATPLIKSPVQYFHNNLKLQCFWMILSSWALLPKKTLFFSGKGPNAKASSRMASWIELFQDPRNWLNLVIIASCFN